MIRLESGISPIKDIGELQARQGVTTTINGNCGLSIAPCPASRRADILHYLKPTVGSLPPGIEFDSFGDYLHQVERQPLPINFGMHVGNGVLRMAAKGFAPGPLSREELAVVHDYLREAILAGAFGVSIGLAYAPENNYNAAGLIEALKPMAGLDLPLVAHIRSEGGLLLESVREVITVAKGLSVPLHISHYKCGGASNWGHLLRKTTDLIEVEQAGGMSITCDAYPWLAGSALLAQILPPEFLEGGLAETTKRLKEPNERYRCREILLQPQTEFENQALLLGWENIVVASVRTDTNSDCVGRCIADIAAERGADPCETALRLLADEECEVAMINFIACEEDVRFILRLPYSLIISDSIYPDGGRPHPRQTGSFPKILAEYVRDNGVLSLASAVRKFTGSPAERFNIKAKGKVQEGYDADLVVFDLAAMRNNATYQDPKARPTGFLYVLVNGVIVNDHDVFIRTDAGRVIRRGAHLTPSKASSNGSGAM